MTTNYRGMNLGERWSWIDLSMNARLNRGEQADEVLYARRSGYWVMNGLNGELYEDGLRYGVWRKGLWVRSPDWDVERGSHWTDGAGCVRRDWLAVVDRTRDQSEVLIAISVVPRGSIRPVLVPDVLDRRTMMRGSRYRGKTMLLIPQHRILD